MFSRWREHFERNRLRPLPDLRGAWAEVPASARALLARSLAVFQLGESKGGRLAIEIDKVPELSEDYRAAIKLFVEEELRHGCLLALCVEGLGGQLVETTWTESLFVGARRLLGVRFKLVVLLAAEAVGLGFYRTVGARLPDGVLRACLDEICADEVQHLRFHGDAFRGRPAFRYSWYGVVAVATAVVLVDHRRTLRAMGVPLARALANMVAVHAGIARDLAGETSPAPGGRGDARDTQIRSSTMGTSTT